MQHRKGVSALLLLIAPILSACGTEYFVELVNQTGESMRLVYVAQIHFDGGERREQPREVERTLAGRFDPGQVAMYYDYYAGTVDIHLRGYASDGRLIYEEEVSVDADDSETCRLELVVAGETDSSPECLPLAQPVARFTVVNTTPGRLDIWFDQEPFGRIASGAASEYLLVREDQQSAPLRLLDEGGREVYQVDMGGVGQRNPGDWFYVTPEGVTREDPRSNR